MYGMCVCHIRYALPLFLPSVVLGHYRTPGAYVRLLTGWASGPTSVLVIVILIDLSFLGLLLCVGLPSAPVIGCHNRRGADHPIHAMSAMFFVFFYLGERNPTGWPHMIQLGEPNCQEPEALPHQ
jgi:hypothetical protein